MSEKDIIEKLIDWECCTANEESETLMEAVSYIDSLRQQVAELKAENERWRAGELQFTPDGLYIGEGPMVLATKMYEYLADKTVLEKQVSDLQERYECKADALNASLLAMDAYQKEVDRLREAFKQIELLCEQYDEPVSMILGATRQAL